MSKITRQTYVQFGVNVNSASDICAFGTPATGSPVYTTSIPTLQGQTAWTTGWAAETVASNRPFLEDMNATHYVFSYMLAYLFEMGIPEWDAGTTYYTNSIVQSGGILYQSLVDTNLNNAVGTTVNWRQFTAPEPYVKISNTQSSGVGGGTTTSGAWNTVIFNTKDTDTASIATLSSNQITLPIGTYKINIRTSLNGASASTNQSQSRLYNVTTSAVALVGTSEYANQAGVGVTSQIIGQLTLATSTTLQIQYQVGNGLASNGLGVPASYGTEVYAIAEFTKIS